MTYSDSADGIEITWKRAIQELDRHGVPSSEHITFVIECWSIHATGDTDTSTILASHVLNWLGY